MQPTTLRGQMLPVPCLSSSRWRGQLAARRRTPPGGRGPSERGGTLQVFSLPAKTKKAGSGLTWHFEDKP